MIRKQALDLQVHEHWLAASTDYMKCCLRWYLDKVVISYSEVWDIISGSLLASSQNTPEHVLIQLTTCTQ